MPPDPLLSYGAVVPPFSLADAHGRQVSRTHYRGRRHLALLFCADLVDGLPYLQELAAQYEAISAASGALLVIVRSIEPEALLSLEARLMFPFPLLIDPTSTVTARFLPTETQAGLFITDRYGELYFQQFAATTAALPPATEVVNWLEAIDHQCSV